VLPPVVILLQALFVVTITIASYVAALATLPIQLTCIPIVAAIMAVIPHAAGSAKKDEPHQA
jgi:hypothetical protein